MTASSLKIFALILLCGLTTAIQGQVQPNPADGDGDPAREAQIQNLTQMVATALQERELDKARQSLEEALELAPDNDQILGLYGALLIYEKSYDEARTVYRGLLERQPENYSSIWNLAEIEFLTDNYGPSRELLRTLQEKNESDEMVSYKIGLTYLLEDDIAKAQAEFEKIEFPSDTPAYYFAQAALAFKQDNPTEAHSWVQESARIFPFQHNALFADSLIEKGVLKLEEILPGFSITDPVPDENVTPELGSNLLPE
ncbi:MAG: tetratricopeptide repeat protein [Verrucomicrobiales bacterium]